MSSTSAVSPSWRSEARRRSLAALAVVIGGYAFVLLLDRLHGDAPSSLCAFRQVTGIPCPGCGMGRATLALFRGDLAAAWSYHILVVPFTAAVGLAVMGLAADLWRGDERYARMLRARWPHWASIAALALVAAAWAINLARGI